MDQERNWIVVLKRPAVWIVLIGIVLVAVVLFAIRPNEPVVPAAAGVTPTDTSISSPSPTPGPTTTATPIPSATLPPTDLPTFTSPVNSPDSPVVPPRSASTTDQESNPVSYGYKIVNIYPHDRSAFTQGLVFTDGIFYEGTGLKGQSTLRKVDPKTGEVLELYRLPDQFFGEGITIYHDKLFQLTFKSGVGFVYDKNSFALLEEFEYPTEGWGLTYDGQQLIMSDGTANLYFRDPETFEEIRRAEVRDANGPVTNLNELEYIQGQVYANIWKTDRIAIIDPQSGKVTGWIALEGLLSQEDRSQQVDVLNGIAYDAANDRLFVTGKWWPKLFEIELVPKE
jgi:glutamine cyclotransferase